MVIDGDSFPVLTGMAGDLFCRVTSAKGDIACEQALRMGSPRFTFKSRNIPHGEPGCRLKVTRLKGPTVYEVKNSNTKT